MDNWYQYVGDVAQSWGVSFAVPQITPPIGASLDVPDPVQIELPVPPSAPVQQQAAAPARQQVQQSGYTVHGQYSQTANIRAGASGRATGLLP